MRMVSLYRKRKHLFFWMKYVGATLNFGRACGQLWEVNIHFWSRLLVHWMMVDCGTIKPHLPQYQESFAKLKWMCLVSDLLLDFVHQVRLKLQTQWFLNLSASPGIWSTNLHTPIWYTSCNTVDFCPPIVNSLESNQFASLLSSMNPGMLKTSSVMDLLAGRRWRGMVRAFVMCLNDRVAILEAKEKLTNSDWATV